MDSGEIYARHYATGQPVQVQWQAGKFVRIAPGASGASTDVWVAPALFDLQINGFAGIDFQQDHLTVEALITANRGLQVAGCTRYLVTLITDEWSRMMARLRQLRQLRAQSAELMQSIQGWHIEGPFLSPEPGFHGAHEPQWMCDPTLEHLRELRQITGSDRVLLTLAPERQGAIEAIQSARQLGIKIFIGHTNASAEVLIQAVQAGATGFTHLSNGCPQLLDRHDNILWRVFERPELMVSLIPDGIHVSPSLFRLMHRVLAPASILYITDAMSAAGAPPGRYRIGQLELEVGADQIVRHPSRRNYAGSALRPMDGIFRAAHMLNSTWQKLWSRASDQPAQCLGLPYGLAPGQLADFCLLQCTNMQQLEKLTVYVNGKPIHG